MEKLKYWVTPATTWEFGRSAFEILSHAYCFLFCRRTEAIDFMAEKSMENSSPGAGEEVVPWVIWCHGNTI